MHRVDRADACKLSYGLYTNTMAHACTQKFMCMYTCKICNVKKEKCFYMFRTDAISFIAFRT